MGRFKYEVGDSMIESIHACVDLLHVGYRVKDAYDPIILNVYHCLKMENLNDEQYMLHIDSVLNKKYIFFHLVFLFNRITNLNL